MEDVDSEVNRVSVYMDTCETMTSSIRLKAFDT